ncbi:MAG: hypothetical protein ABJQ29_15000 [Luteolibacter sp.]
MTKDQLVFDWGGGETRLIDKIMAPVLVALFFAAFFGLVDVRVGTVFQESSDTASIIRFESTELADKWLLIAEEGGPFPGRLEIGSSVPGSDASLASMAGDPFAGNSYEVSMRKIKPDFGVARVELAPKGLRTFPEISKGGEGTPREPSKTTGVDKQPVLTPYDKAALEWIPEDLPLFSPAEGTDTSGSPWRFVLSLRSDGTVNDCVSLGGGEAGLEEINRWLRGLTFATGEDERWLALRVVLINRRDNGSGSE